MSMRLAASQRTTEGLARFYLRWLREQPWGVRRSEFYRYPRPAPTREELDAALALLEADGLATRWVDDDHIGRPAEVWRLTVKGDTVEAMP